jgi:hypothetical protein
MKVVKIVLVGAAGISALRFGAFDDDGITGFVTLVAVILCGIALLSLACLSWRRTSNNRACSLCPFRVLRVAEFKRAAPTVVIRSVARHSRTRQNVLCCWICGERRFISQNYGDLIRLRCTCGNSVVISSAAYFLMSRPGGTSRISQR